ncbi:hypothetical protein H2201_007805 [Coniosporium apollinis]|uniref:Hemerythrin-like domain-containing protein n=1 Tax=Coniosporium apollinis TaxID=61459 RepID=A0ABQ9NHT5_9PEZI|nr:hypothetical protein H2201_007805 [Coniosporium apollinis]
MADVDPQVPQPPLDNGATPPIEAEPKLPKLSATEFRMYNRMAEHMDMFHENFRRTWNMLYNACTTNKRPSGMSIRQFLGAGIDFCHHLEVHHSIEEQHVFPILARKMPAFRKELELLTQHKQIHKGMDEMSAYLEACKTGEKELRLDELREIMDKWGAVLWQHLDDEVRQLGAENMRKYWTLEEMRRIPI